MGTNTGIEWTDATWNPIRGCSPVSPGCKNCYAKKVAKRLSFTGGPYEGLVRINAAGERTDDWNGNIRFVEPHLLNPLKWREPRRIFVNSMSDLFHENVTDDMLCSIFKVMCEAKRHIFQVLTKRPARMLDFISRWNSKTRDFGPLWPNTCPQSHVWLGVSVENQKAADDRLDYLCELASLGWRTMVSFEPLLSAVDPGSWWLSLGAKTWAIVGGESGPGARPMHPDWARALRDQCTAAGVPFFFKQWGEWAKAVDRDIEDPDWRFDYARVDRRDSLRILNLAGGCGFHGDRVHVMRRGGKHAAGALLDGREWKQFPEGRA